MEFNQAELEALTSTIRKVVEPIAAQVTGYIAKLLEDYALVLDKVQDAPNAEAMKTALVIVTQGLRNHAAKMRSGA